MGEFFWQTLTPFSEQNGHSIRSLRLRLWAIIFGLTSLAASGAWADQPQNLTCANWLTLSPIQIGKSQVQWSPSERFALNLDVPLSGASSISLYLYLIDTQKRQRIPLKTEIPSPYRVFRPGQWVNSAAQFFPISWSPNEEFVLVQMLLSKSNRVHKTKEVALVFSTATGELVAVPGFQKDYGYQINAILFDKELPHLSMTLFRHQQYLGTSFETWNLQASDYLGGGDILGEDRLNSIWRQHREALSLSQVSSYQLQPQDFVNRPLFLSPNGDYSLQLRADQQGFEVVRVKSNPTGDSPLKRSKVTEMRMDIDPQKSQVHWLRNGKILVVHSGERAWYWNSETGHLETFAADRILFHQDEMVVLLVDPQQVTVRAYHLDRMTPLQAGFSELGREALFR